MKLKHADKQKYHFTWHYEIIFDTEFMQLGNNFNRSFYTITTTFNNQYSYYNEIFLNDNCKNIVIFIKLKNESDS